MKKLSLIIGVIAIALVGCEKMEKRMEETGTEKKAQPATPTKAPNENQAKKPQPNANSNGKKANSNSLIPSKKTNRNDYED